MVEYIDYLIIFFISHHLLCRPKETVTSNEANQSISTEDESPTDGDQRNKKGKSKGGRPKRDPLAIIPFDEKWYPADWLVFLFYGPQSEKPAMIWRTFTKISQPDHVDLLDDSDEEGDRTRQDSRVAQRKEERKIKRGGSSVSDDVKTMAMFSNSMAELASELKASRQVKEESSRLQMELDAIKLLNDPELRDSEAKRILKRLKGEKDN